MPLHVLNRSLSIRLRWNTQFEMDAQRISIYKDRFENLFSLLSDENYLT